MPAEVVAGKDEEEKLSDQLKDVDVEPQLLDRSPGSEGHVEGRVALKVVFTRFVA